jgi:hypothetical protein
MATLVVAIAENPPVPVVSSTKPMPEKPHWAPAQPTVTFLVAPDEMEGRPKTDKSTSVKNPRKANRLYLDFISIPSTRIVLFYNLSVAGRLPGKCHHDLLLTAPWRSSIYFGLIGFLT